jgi:hypothetical protein
VVEIVAVPSMIRSRPLAIGEAVPDDIRTGAGRRQHRQRARSIRRSVDSESGATVGAAFSHVRAPCRILAGQWKQLSGLSCRSVFFHGGVLVHRS